MAKIPTFSATSTGPRFPEPKARFPKVPRRRGRGPGQAVGLRGAIEEGRVSVTSIPRDHGSRTRPALSRACAPADPGPHPFAAGRVGADALRLFRSFRRRRRCNPQICANLGAGRVKPAGGGHLQVSVPSTPASSACPPISTTTRIGNLSSAADVDEIWNGPIAVELRTSISSRPSSSRGRSRTKPCAIVLRRRGHEAQEAAAHGFLRAEAATLRDPLDRLA